LITTISQRKSPCSALPTSSHQPTSQIGVIQNLFHPLPRDAQFGQKMSEIEQSLNLDTSTLETIERRKIILLDTSVWIFLADGKTTQAAALRARLQQLVASEIVICPLSAPTIWELRKQKFPSLTRTAELMEQLSLNVSFRGIDQIFDSEVACFIEYLLTGTFRPLRWSEKFGPVLSYIDKKVALNIDFDLSPDDKHSIAKQIAATMQSLSLTKLISMLGDQSSPTVDTRGAYQSSSRARLEIAGKSKAKALRIEQEDAARRILIPKINFQRRRLAISDQTIVVQRMELLEKRKKYGDALDHVLGFMPALSAYVHMLTVSGFDPNRIDSPNDFYDREILVYGLSYSTVFAAFDSWIASLIGLSRSAGYPGFFEFAKDSNDLHLQLESIK
jgi:hypothetical protein